LWYVLYLAAHLLLYVVVLRHRPAFRSERTIFLYHAVSAILVTLAAILGPLLMGAGLDFEWIVAVVALHGIYSVSFLELWSLAEGGYSLQILERLDRAERQGQRVDLEELRAIGAAKQSNRLAGLTSAGLVQQQGGRVELTGAGQVVGSLFALLAWLTNVQDGV
jgi:hypothetical protein